MTWKNRLLVCLPAAERRRRTGRGLAGKMLPPPLPVHEKNTNSAQFLAFASLTTGA